MEVVAMIRNILVNSSGKLLKGNRRKHSKPSLNLTLMMVHQEEWKKDFLRLRLIKKTKDSLEKARQLRKEANRKEGEYEFARYKQKNSPNPPSEKFKKADQRRYNEFIEANKAAIAQYRKYADELLGKYGDRKVVDGLFSIHRKTARDILISNLL